MTRTRAAIAMVRVSMVRTLLSFARPGGARGVPFRLRPQPGAQTDATRRRHGSTLDSQGYFSAPAKRSRAELRQANRRTAISTDSFVPSDGRAVFP
jgi:hypothetical protein